MSDNIENNIKKIKELKQLLDSGTITQTEFALMKASILRNQSQSTVVQSKTTAIQPKPKIRKGVGWQEILAVFFGIFGGVAYFFTKQSLSKKIIIFILSIIATGIYGAIPESEDNRPDVAPSTPESSKQSVEFLMGQKVEVDGRSIVVNNAVELKTLNIQDRFAEDIQTSGKFVRVNLIAQNTSNETGDFLFSTFELKDYQGRTYNAIDNFDKKYMFVYMNEQGLGKMRRDIFPGGSVNDALFFETPNDASGFSLLWKGKTIRLY